MYISLPLSPILYVPMASMAVSDAMLVEPDVVIASSDIAASCFLVRKGRCCNEEGVHKIHYDGRI